MGMQQLSDIMASPIFCDLFGLDGVTVHTECAHCGRKEAALTCAGCMLTIYCCKACQRKDWPLHKAWCWINPAP